MIEPRRISHSDTWVGVEYATICPFSAQNKWLLLQDGRGYYALHAGKGEFDRLTFLGHNQEARWDSNDPDVLYYISGNTIRRYDAMTHESSLVQIFTEYMLFTHDQRNGVQGLGEGDIEGHIWALAGMRQDGRRDVFLYDVRRARKSKVLTLDRDDAQPQTVQHSGRAHGLDNVYATSSGNCQIGWHAQGKDRFQGVELYGQDMEFIRQLAPVLSHNDVASYQGKDVLIWGSSADATINKNALFAIDNQTGEKRELLNLDWKYAYHVSACARDFCVVSTYAPDNALPSHILKLKLDGSGHEVLAETGAMMMKNADGGMAYNPTPRAAVSSDGTRIVFNSNHGDTSRGENYVDVFLVELDKPIAPPQPEPPIVVQPEPDSRDQKIIALEKAIAQLQATNAQLDERRIRIAAESATQIATLEQQIDMLTNALVSVRAIDVDPEIWQPVRFKPEQLGQRWTYEVIDPEHVSMNDVGVDGTLTRIVEPALIGNRYLFRAVLPNGREAEERKLAFEMYQAISNRNPWQ